MKKRWLILLAIAFLIHNPYIFWTMVKKIIPFLFIWIFTGPFCLAVYHTGGINGPCLHGQLFYSAADTIAPDPASADVYFNSKKTKIRTKEVQSKDYRYGKKNLMSFIYAVAFIQCMVLVVVFGQLGVGALAVLLAIAALVFCILGTIMGIKGLKEKKMRILGVLGLSINGLYLIIVVYTLLVTLFFLILAALSGL